MIVTIIVLLILAGITISLVFSENGIIKKAHEAANRMNEAITKEQTELNDLDNILNDMLQGNEGYNNYVDGVIIPNGFYYVGGKKDTGLIISDNVEDYNKGDSHEVTSTLKGNQFVWIPVENYEATDFDNSGLTYTEDLDETMKEENKAIEASIEKYGGFYVGRYETGEENGKAVVKQGKEVLQVGLDEAITSSRNMYNSETVGSTLIHGKQWDSTMNFLSSKFNIKDSSQYGNYANYIIDNENSITTSEENKNRLPIVRTNYNKILGVIDNRVTTGHIAIIAQVSNTEFIVPSYESTQNFSLTAKLEERSEPAYIRLKYQIEDPNNIIKNKNEFVDSKGLPEECLNTEEDIFNWNVPKIKMNVNNTKEDIDATINITVDALQKANIDIPPEGGWPKEYSKKQRNYNKNDYYVSAVSNKNIIDENLKLAYFSDTDTVSIKITSISNKPKTTGYNNKWNVNNIYDMAGNNYEWTVEKANDKYVIRGGQYYNIGNTDYIAKRTLEDKQNAYGYRVALYVK